MENASSAMHYLVPIASVAPTEIKEKGSRFISYIFPVTSAEEATAILHTIRKEHYNATHVCFAWIIGDGEEKAFRYSDDGEPNGTAGAPLYNVIKGSDVFNILIISVRYYGGTKLGTGGLIRAYTASAKAAIEMVKTRTVIPQKECILETPFNQIGIVTHLVELIENSDIMSREYRENGVIITVKIPIAYIDDFMQKVTDATASRTKIRI